MTIRNSTIINEYPINDISLFFKYNSPPNITLTHPQLEIKNYNRPTNIIIIIGESHSKIHSSLYGYSKDTNPRLSSIKENLYVFNNVCSPGRNTINAFKCFMSTYDSQYKDSTNWHSCTTILEILNIIGYKTIWLSNQSKKGLYDNEIGKYADICTENIFIGNKFAGMNRNNCYDESLINVAKEIKTSSINKEKRPYIFHLMGSHFNFKHRYPQHYNIFNTNDYESSLLEQRAILAEYDNSILYNDYVTSEIINLFKNDESLIFYFSDHGLDVFNSAQDYCGHPRNNKISEFYGKQIPFWIYTSEIYKKNNPQKIETISNSINRPFNTTHFIYSLMDLIEINFKNNNNVNRYSLFKTNKQS